MTTSRHADRRDANEKDIVAAALKHPQVARVIRMPRGAGFDLLIILKGSGPMPPVEVKNPATRWAYTDAENDMLALCAESKIPYYTVQTATDIEHAINAEFLRKALASYGLKEKSPTA